MKYDNICYTGINALPSGNHTKKQFLQITDEFKSDCPEFVKMKRCKSCKKYKKMLESDFKRQAKMNRKITLRKDAKFTNQRNKCNKCKNGKTRKCNLKDLMSYAGANPGKCHNDIEILNYNTIQ